MKISVKKHPKKIQQIIALKQLFSFIFTLISTLWVSAQPPDTSNVFTDRIQTALSFLKEPIKNFKGKIEYYEYQKDSLFPNSQTIPPKKPDIYGWIKTLKKIEHPAVDTLKNFIAIGYHKEKIAFIRWETVANSYKSTYVIINDSVMEKWVTHSIFPMGPAKSRYVYQNNLLIKESIFLDQEKKGLPFAVDFYYYWPSTNKLSRNIYFSPPFFANPVYSERRYDSNEKFYSKISIYKHEDLKKKKTITGKAINTENSCFLLTDDKQVYYIDSLNQFNKRYVNKRITATGIIARIHNEVFENDLSKWEDDHEEELNNLDEGRIPKVILKVKPKNIRIVK